MLVLFASSLKAGDSTVRIFKDAAGTVRGQGTMVLVDCSGSVSSPFFLCISSSSKKYVHGNFSKLMDGGF